jgi:hypothetical protein
MRPPDLGRGTPVHLRKDRIETAQAAEPSSRCNLDHRQFGIVQKSLRSLHPCGLGNLTGAGAEMFFEQSGQMSRPDANAIRERVNRRIIECALADQSHRALDGRP